ncbi:MAG: DMT family transporter [Candidatus Puniceispirillaceae bacterium]
MSGWMQRPFVALGLLALGMGLIPLNDALIKLMSAYMPLAEIAFIRGVLSLLVLAVFSRGVISMLQLPAAVFWSFFGRGMCLVVAMILYFVPLGSLPLPTVITIFFVSPLLITLLSVPFLGEKIGIHRILSVCMGLAGVLVIIRPGTDEFQVETVIVFAAALAYAVFQIWTRRLKSVGNLSAMVTVQQVCYVAAFGPILLVNYLAPRAPSDNATLDFLLRAPAMPGAQDGVFLVICTLSVLFLSMASSNAYRSVEASLIAPFEYTAIPFAVVWGIVIWGEWPDALSYLGMGLILAGGLYTIWRERARDVEVMTATPMPASASAAQPAEEEDSAT